MKVGELIIPPVPPAALFEAEAERVWKSRGARRPAYSSIVGSGPNSTILHDPRGEGVVQDGELKLRPGSAEGRVEAEADRTGNSRGERRPAYSGIVSSGPNTSILHYPRT